MDLSVYLLYAYIGIICSLVVGIILNRTLATKYKQSIDKKLVHVFIFFIIFCFFDALWGITGLEPVASKVPSIYEIATYLFHILAACSSFAISVYAVHYFSLNSKSRNRFKIYRCLIFSCQLALIIINIIFNFASKKFWFVIDDGGVYHTNSKVIRYIVFALQFLQYIPLAIYALVKGNKKPNYKTRYFAGTFFLAIPFIFGILQMLYPDGPFYSLGFAVFSVAIYAINVTGQREKFLEDYHRVDSAQKANEAKSNFLANMSHDIRTPINGIMGLTMLAKSEQDPTKVKEYINKIDNTSQHLLSLVNDVLDMTRIENMQGDILNEDKINMYTVIDNCKSIISGQLIGNKVKLICNTENKLKNPYVLGDELRIKQILINLLGNSVKFTHQGYISLKISDTPVQAGITNYIFEVQDTGIGMSEEFMSKIFEPFSQEKTNARSNYQGTGLGMSITKELVDLMKGKIEVKSQVNVGTTFTITIPFQVCENSTYEENVKEIKEDFSMQGVKCLLVEDNELNMEIASTILSQYGAIVTPAADGLKALETFKESAPNTFDIIFMDIMMPNMNGYNATIEIRKLDREDAKNIPIIAMTANAFEEDKKKAIASGMNGHIAKPINFDMLLQEVKKNLGKRK